MEYRLIFNFLLAIFPRENKQPRGKYILRGDIMRYKIETYALKCFTNLLFLLVFFPIFRSRPAYQVLPKPFFVSQDERIRKITNEFLQVNRAF